MRPSPDIRYDVATALSRGQRHYQEDAIVADFPIGSDTGFAVLSDGMGGHSAGDVASKIVLTEVYSELKLQSGAAETFAAHVPDILESAALAANECIKSHVGQHPNTRGMGATLIAPVFLGTQLYWISVGDSPLYLFRDGSLSQLNEDHSMAPQIDLMVQSGLLDPEEGAEHPDRNCLTSVLIGEEIAQIDCPKEPFTVQDGDVLLAASDGLQFLDDDEIEDVLRSNATRPSTEIADLLMHELEELADPDQDNISFSVIRVTDRAKPGMEPDVPVENFMSEQVETLAAQGNGQMVLAKRPGFNPFSLFRRMFSVREDLL
jgi:serine/threonine protein phosphatase PrpC